jgi:tetratricopeptide (TPR) repeat protein
MTSPEARQTPKIAAGMLAALAVSCAGFAQPADELSQNEKHLRQILDTIEEIQDQDGSYSPDLIDPLRAMGLLYQEGEEPSLAAAAFQRALQVVRANSGLYSLDQAPLIRRLIDYERASGDAAEAWDLEHELLTLVTRHPDDLRIVPILHAVADHRLAVLRRYYAGEYPPEIVLGCYYAARGEDSMRRFRRDRRCTSGSRSVVIQSILADAWRYYSDAIRIFSKHELYSSTELRALEARIIRSTYLFGGDYSRGTRSYRRLIDYSTANSEPPLTRVKTLVEATDWKLLFERNSGTVALDRILDTYEQAYERLEQTGIAPTSIQQLFSPRVPVVLPTFLPNPLASDQTPKTTGYIDVAFDVTKYGDSRRVEILDTTTNATDAATDRLVRLVQRCRFRPRVTNGEVADVVRMVVRYYLNE